MKINFDKTVLTCQCHDGLRGFQYLNKIKATPVTTKAPKPRDSVVGREKKCELGVQRWLYNEYK